MDRPLDPELLLRHSRWLKALARSLVSDESRAEDLVQETLLRAIERPPLERSAGAWLRKVRRNLAFRGREEERRRRRREKVVARPIDSPPVASRVVERVEMLRRLVDMVLELEEPGRSALLDHFFDGLPP